MSTPDWNAQARQVWLKWWHDRGGPVTDQAPATLVEVYWQHHMQTPYSPEAYMEFLGLRAEVEAMDLPALRQLAHQHAEALRDSMSPHYSGDLSPTQVARAAADFLDGPAE